MAKVIANVAFGIGTTIMTIGGCLLAVCLILFLVWLVQVAWIAFSGTFRGIFKAESMLWEYRKNREEFLKWKEGAEDG